MLANLLILFYGTSTESYRRGEINGLDILADGYKTHFTFIILMTLLVPLVCTVLDVPSPIDGFSILLPIILDSIVRKKFNIKSKIYTEDK